MGGGGGGGRGRLVDSNDILTNCCYWLSSIWAIVVFEANCLQ